MTKTLGAIVISFLSSISANCSEPVSSQDDDLAQNGYLSLVVAGVLQPLPQLVENASKEGGKVKASVRVIWGSGFSLEDLVLLIYEDGTRRIYWRSGVRKNVCFGLANIEQLKKRQRFPNIGNMEKLIHLDEFWTEEKRLTGPEMDDGERIIFARLKNENLDTARFSGRESVMSSSFRETFMAVSEFWAIQKRAEKIPKK